MKILTHYWAKKPDAEVPVAAAVFDSLMSADHDAAPGETAENNARAIAVIVEALVGRGLLETETVATILNGHFRIEG